VLVTLALTMLIKGTLEATQGDGSKALGAQYPLVASCVWAFIMMQEETNHLTNRIGSKRGTRE
jgi:hypothetical protein